MPKDPTNSPETSAPVRDAVLDLPLNDPPVYYGQLLQNAGSGTVLHMLFISGYTVANGG